jgi:hypothetical protein
MLFLSKVFLESREMSQRAVSKRSIQEADLGTLVFLAMGLKSIQMQVTAKDIKGTK